MMNTYCGLNMVVLVNPWLTLLLPPPKAGLDEAGDEDPKGELAKVVIETAAPSPRRKVTLRKA